MLSDKNITTRKKKKRHPTRDTSLFAFWAKVENINTFATLLKSIHFTDKVNVMVVNQGIKFTVEEGKAVQASVFFQRTIFDEFQLKKDFVRFKIPLKEMMNCLKVFFAENKVGSDSIGDIPQNAKMNIMYEGQGAPFIILLEERGAVIDFQISTEETDDLMEFNDIDTKGKINLKSEPMRELFGEIDANSPEYVDMKLISKDRLQLSCHGTCGAMKIIIPENSDIVEGINCEFDCVFSYKFSMLKHMFKALQYSQKFELKFSIEGILSFNFIMASKSNSCIEFICLPMVHDETSDSLLQD